MKRCLLVAALFLAACSDVATTSDPVDATSDDVTTCTGDASHFVNLNDACKRKVQPTNRDRVLTCPVVSTDGAGFQTSNAAPEIDTHAFDAVAPFDPKNPVRVVGVVVRRVGGVPHYQYLSNGHENEIIQPWSSSKFIGVMAAGSNLRVKSNGAVGLTATVNGHPLGDLVSDIASYESRISTSNGTARWFKNVAGRDYANGFVTDWLGRKGEEFRGAYGTDLAPYGYTITAASGAKVTVPNDDQQGFTNLLSMFTEVEMMKRLALWDDEATRMPGLEAEDVQTILYGAEQPVAYKGEAGGLMRDTAIYMQNALDLKRVEADSHGRWRIFSKLGYGEAARDGLGNVAEMAHVAYACLPVLDAAGAPVPDQGAELVLAIHATNRSAKADDAALDALYKRVVNEVLLPRARP